MSTNIGVLIGKNASMWATGKVLGPIMAWSFGSFHLLGDVPALMPIAKSVKVGGMKWYHPSDPRHVRGQGFNTIADRQNREGNGPSESGLKHGGDWFSDQSSPSRQGGQVRKQVAEGRKSAGAEWFDGNLCVKSSNSSARKHASAKIARIPLPLSRWIAAVYKPR